MAIVKSLINWGMLSSSHFVQCNSVYIECTYVSTMLHRIDSFYIFKWFQLYWRVAYFRKKCPLYYLAKEREDAAEKLFHTRTWSLTPQDGASAAALPGCNWNWRRRIIWKSCKNLSMLGLCLCKITNNQDVFFTFHQSHCFWKTKWTECFGVHKLHISERYYY